MEGGYGKIMKDIVNFASNTRDLMITLDTIWHPDSPVGLTQALGTMKNIKRMGLTRLAEERTFPKSKAVTVLLELVCECIVADWPSLVRHCCVPGISRCSVLFDNASVMYTFHPHFGTCFKHWNQPEAYSMPSGRQLGRYICIYSRVSCG